MTDILRGFKQFLLRGNVVDLAIGVVIGIAFGAVVTAFVEDLLTPLIGALIGEPDFSGLTFTINGSVFYYGDFINKVITFISIATAIYFLVVMPINRLTRPSRTATPDPEFKRCPECLSLIAAEATRCAYCTAVLTQVPQRPTSSRSQSEP